jgi:hypothetical protein
MAFRAWQQGEDWITWCIECVDFHMERHYRDREPNVQTQGDFQYYVTRHGVSSNYGQRTHEQLIGDVNVLHDFTRKLVKEKNQMQHALTKAETQVRWANFRIWALTLALATEGSIIGWLVHEWVSK